MAGKLPRLHAAVKGGESRHHVGDQKHHQQHHQHNQHAGVNQRRHHLLADRQRRTLVGDVAVQHLHQAAAFFPGHYRGDVHFGENALLAEGFGEQRAPPYLVAHGLNVGSELGIGEALGKQVEALQNGQAGADQGNELLVEDEELLQVQLFLPAEDPQLWRRFRCGVVRGLIE